MRTATLSFLAALLLAGCGASQRLVTYNTKIDAVERPSDAKERYGEYTVSQSDTAGYVYEDDLVRATFVSGGSTVLTSVQNKTDHSIQIRVEQGAFVLPGGKSDRILLGDMSYAGRNNQVQPITVPSGASSSATFIPESKVRMGYQDVVVDPIIYPGSIGGMGQNKTTVADVRGNIGKKYQLLLPIEIQGTVNEYTFTFEVAGAKIDAGSGKSQKVVGEYPNQ
jgi:hypothetical protein